jgi:hypothetical protein
VSKKPQHKDKVTGVHAFGDWKIINYSYCAKCGLILLRNKQTEKARDKKCPGRESE